MTKHTLTIPVGLCLLRNLVKLNRLLKSFFFFCIFLRKEHRDRVLVNIKLISCLRFSKQTSPAFRFLWSLKSQKKYENILLSKLMHSFIKLVKFFRMFPPDYSICNLDRLNELRCYELDWKSTPSLLFG